MGQELPKPVTEFKKRYPEVWKAFTELGERCLDAGPLTERDRRLVKLALSIGAGLEGATHSAVRKAKRAGVSNKEIDHVVVLAVTTLGLPSATRAFTWIRDKSKLGPTTNTQVTQGGKLNFPLGQLERNSGTRTVQAVTCVRMARSNS